MYFHRRQTCTKRLSKPKFVTCNLKLELKLLSTILSIHYPNQHKSTHAEIKKQTLALSVILDEFEINRLGKLMFRTVVNSFFLERLTDIASDDIRYFFRREKKTLKIYLPHYHNSVVHIKL